MGSPVFGSGAGRSSCGGESLPCCRWLHRILGARQPQFGAAAVLQRTSSVTSCLRLVFIAYCVVLVICRRDSRHQRRCL